MFPDAHSLSEVGWQRCPQNPLLIPASVQPSIPSFKVVGVFNPGAVSTSLNETVLLLRVSETFIHGGDQDTFSVPLATPMIAAQDSVARNSLNVKKLDLRRDDPSFDFQTDSRVVLSRKTELQPSATVKYLTSISHLRRARSNDGVHFTVDKTPFLFPGFACPSSTSLASLTSTSRRHLEAMLRLEEWGIEDPRIVDMHHALDESWCRSLPTHVQETLASALGSSSKSTCWRFLVSYTAVSRFGAATSLAVVDSTFDVVERLGVIFVPENKDVCIFPKAFSSSSESPSYFFCYHRPVPKSFGNADIWAASSPDLLSWGNHVHCIGTAASDDEPVGSGTQLRKWDGGRVGGGAPSVLCSKGWLHVYHAADVHHRYCLGVFVANSEDPTLVIARTSQPILCPDESYEAVGFFPNVVFTCGVVLHKKNTGDEGDDELWIYYGAADDKVALCVFTLRFIFASLQPQE